MAIYSYGQLEQLWINAGGARSLAPVAAAIAEAESGGDSEAVNASDNNGTQTSWGPWQISNGTHSWPGAADPLNPANNAAYAVAKYQESGWKPWGTYTSGAYKAFLANNIPPDPSGLPKGQGSTGGSSQGGGSGGGTCVTGEVFGFCPLSKSEARAVIGGLVMTAGALIVLPGIIILVAAGFRAVPGGPDAAGRVAGAAGKLPVYGRAFRAVSAVTG